MIKKIFSLARYSFLTGVGILLGFVRELVVSSHFGLSKELDVYIAMGGFFLFLGPQVGNALEMVFISKTAQLDTAAKLTQRLMQGLRVMLVVDVAVVGILLSTASYLVAWIFPGFSEEQRELGVAFVAHLCLAIVFANLAGLIRASLNIMRRFSPGLIAGSIVSVFSIATVVVYGDRYGVRALLYGFICGHAAVLVLNTVMFLRFADFSYRGNKEQRSRLPSFWGPVFLVLLLEAFFQARSMTERGFASTLETGTVSAFFYASTLITLPVSLVVTPLSTVLYPRLAEAFAEDRRRGYSMLKRYGGGLFVFAVIIALIISVASEEIVKVVFLRGRFTPDDASRTAHILSIVSLNLPLLSVTRLIRYSLYSMSNYTAPCVAQVIGWLMMASAGMVLLPRYGIDGLAYSSVLACGSVGLALFASLHLSFLKYDGRQRVVETA
ncbi:lipid II flippase MurJ [Methylocaldum szegediense]|uniref:Virulence factor MVIN family protein n=1 Tax=Methylocaldum szegediense TaxID=73780 RepID=A0ABM9HZE8_9GAMM|nr:lipid II flippase MurJ [Methylocaldum szegediense]CAI8785273.1 conserved membrane protein of unknown function [Methylocaldum szegediense]